MARAKQTVIVLKSCVSTREAAAKMAKKYADRMYTSRETSTSFRFRQRPETDFDQASFRTAVVNKCVRIVYGRLLAKKK